MKILIADDEPHYLDWIEDYLDSKDIGVDYATDVSTAVHLLTENDYRFLLVDLNIPFDETFTGDFQTREDWFRKFPGLYIAYVARNSGYRSKQVIIYSVHLEEAVREYVKTIRCTHVPKGWPQDLKREIDDVISYDPDEASNKTG